MKYRLWQWLGYHGLFQIDWWIKKKGGYQEWSTKDMWSDIIRSQLHWRTRNIFWRIWLFFHINIFARFWNWRIKKLQKEMRLTQVYKKEFDEWMDIDREKDKSLSANDFGFWLYNKKV